MRRLAASWLAVRRHRNQKGQTLIIVAFLSVFLITLVGLVVDSVRLYILAAQAERAAEAASLAGALYMPTYFGTASPDGHYAQERACAVLKQNGITNCPAAAGQVGGQVSIVPTNQYELQVTVTLQSNVFFLAFIAPNLSTTTITRSALAEFLPPIQLGSRVSYFGDQVSGDGTPQGFWASMNGQADLQEEGDAYSVYLQEGPTDAQKYTDEGSYTFSRLTGTTNHPQWGSPKVNPDDHPDGFQGYAGTIGYNYQIVVPSGAGSVDVMIYNPAFINDAKYCGIPPTPPAGTTGDSVDIDADRDPSFGCNKTDAKNEYLQMTYSVYSTPLLFERSADQLKTFFQPASLDALSGDLSAHGCTIGSQLWNPQTQQCVTKPTYVYNWYMLYRITTPGIYRLSVETTGPGGSCCGVGYGSKNYGVKLITDGQPSNSTTAPAGVHIFAWNDMCVYFSLSNGNSTFDLGEIPADYAGKTLNFNLFDPGESPAGSTVKIKILDPSGNAVQVPAWVRTDGGDGKTILASNNGDHIYNGLWLHIPIIIPANYNPAAGSDWWQIQYSNTGGASTDKLTISIGLSGTPVHLVNEIPV
jgi:Flp pilus assembly protein TadG